MPYLTASPWINLLPGVGTITGSSVPLTLDEVATIIARVSAEIDSAAAHAGYTVPIATGATQGGYALVEELCDYGSGWKVLRTVFPNLGGPGDKITLATEYRDAYQAGLKMLRCGETPLLGASLDTSGTGRQLPRSYSTTNVVSSGPLASAIVTLDWEP